MVDEAESDLNEKLVAWYIGSLIGESVRISISIGD
jgi:hypothetical protein